MESLEALENEQLLNFRFRYQPYRNALAFRTEGVSFSYDEATTLINNVSSDLENGKRLAIIGKNGSGKSTLLRLLIGELKPQRWERYDGYQCGHRLFWPDQHRPP